MSGRKRIIRLWLASLQVLLCAHLVQSQALAIAPECERIVSLAPSITEIAFKLGLGGKLVGVTRYDKYPEEVRSLPRVGGLLDPNLEVLYKLQPGIIFALEEQAQSLSKLSKLSLQVRYFRHDGIANILSSIKAIGEVCSCDLPARQLIAELEQKTEEIRNRNKSKKQHKVLLAISGDGQMDFKSLFVSGRDGFYTELLQVVGAKNVFASKTGAFGAVSTEALLTLNPDTILIINSGTSSGTPSRQQLLTIWSDFARIDAVKSGRIYVLEQDYASIPGPRFVNLLGDLEQILN